MYYEISFDFEQNTSNIDFSLDQTNSDMGFSLGNEHSNLTGRDEPDQHPISSITGLQETLDDIKNVTSGNLFSYKGSVNSFSEVEEKVGYVYKVDEDYYFYDGSVWVLINTPYSKKEIDEKLKNTITKDNFNDIVVEGENIKIDKENGKYRISSTANENAEKWNSIKDLL